MKTTSGRCTRGYHTRYLTLTTSIAAVAVILRCFPVHAYTALLPCACNAAAATTLLPCVYSAGKLLLLLLLYKTQVSFFFFSHMSTFQLLDKPWSQVSCLSSPLLFNFYRAWSSAMPLLVSFSSSVANSRSRAFRKSIGALEKIICRTRSIRHNR